MVRSSLLSHFLTSAIMASLATSGLVFLAIVINSSVNLTPRSDSIRLPRISSHSLSETEPDFIALNKRLNKLIYILRNCINFANTLRNNFTDAIASHGNAIQSISNFHSSLLVSNND